MPKYHKTLKILLLLSLIAMSFSAVDAQMNRESPSFSERIPRFDESFLDQPGGVKTQLPASSGISIPAKGSSAQMDLSISAEASQMVCNQVSFSIVLTPDPLQAASSGNQAVKVRLMDQVLGNSQPVAELVLLVPSAGGSTSATIGFPVPADASAEPGWSNEIAIAVDPDNEVAESNEDNNLLIATITCP